MKHLITIILCITAYAGVAQQFKKGDSGITPASTAALQLATGADTVINQISWMAAFPIDSVIKADYKVVIVMPDGSEYVREKKEATFDFKQDSCALDINHYDFLMGRLRHVIFEELDPADSTAIE